MRGGGSEVAEGGMGGRKEGEMGGQGGRSLFGYLLRLAAQFRCRFQNHNPAFALEIMAL